MKVLIVDDLEDMRALVNRTLSLEGLQCDLAETGTVAIEKAAGNDYDLILLDVQLPDMDGYTVCERIKQMQDMQDVPILFLTVLEKPEEVVRGLEKGAVDYIRKPFDKKELLARVNVHLELRRSRKDLKKQIAENRQLVHILCHDLSNPISSMVGLLELMEEHPEESGEFVSLGIQSMNRSLELIDLIRDMSAIEEGKLDGALESVNLKACLDESITMLEKRFRNKSISVNLDVPEDINVIAERSSLVSSVINNILTNAVKFSFEGSSVDINMIAVDDEVLVVIRDYGIGIPERLLNQIFNVSARTNRLGTQKEQGTGFGVPLIKKFVDYYGGTIKIQSWEEGNPDNKAGTEIQISFKKA